MLTFMKRLFGRAQAPLQDIEDTPEELWRAPFKKPDASRLPAEKGDGYRSSFGPDGFILELERKNIFAWTVDPIYRYRDAVFEADILPGSPEHAPAEGEAAPQNPLPDSRRMTNAGTAAGGIIFRYLNESTFYMVLVSDAGMIRMDAVVNGTPLPVLGWTETAAAAAGKPGSRLKIIARGTSFTLIVNERWVAECSDDTIQAPGRIALAGQNWNALSSVRIVFGSLSIDSRPFEIEAVHTRWNSLIPIPPEARVRLAETWLAMGSYVPAILQLKKAEKAAPLQPEARLALARAYLAQRVFEEAEEEFRKIIEARQEAPEALEFAGTDQALFHTDPAEDSQPAQVRAESGAGAASIAAITEARSELGGIFYLQDRYQDLEILLSGIPIEQRRESPFLSNLEGHLLRHKGCHEEAATRYERAGELVPGEGLFHLNAGNEWLKAGLHPRAVDAWLEAGRRYLAAGDTDELEGIIDNLESAGRLSLPEQEYPMQALRGKYHYARGNADEALACFERIEGERCSDSAVWYLSALLRREKGDIQGALERLVRARDLEPGFAAYRFRLAETLRNAGQEYEEELNQALEADDGDGWIHNLAALSLLDKNDPDSAAINLAEARRLLPGEREIVVNLAEVRRRQGRLAEALELLDRSNARELHAGANLLVEEGKYEDAEEWYREALRKTPFDPELLADRAANCLELDLLNEADDLLGRAYDIQPSPRVFLLISFLAGKKGEFTRSEIALQQGLEEFPEETELLRELARVYLHTQRVDNAKAVLRKLKRIDSGPETNELEQDIEERSSQKISCSSCNRYWRVPRNLPPQGSLHLTAQPPDDLPAGTCPACRAHYCIGCAREHLGDDGRFRCKTCNTPLKLVEPGIIWLLNRWQADSPEG